MKFVRFESKGRIAYGILDGETIREVEGSIYGDYKETSASFKVGDVRLLTPCEPATILCVGLNYRSHIQELGQETPVFPVTFSSPTPP